ncbi:MAG TPA: hypothetical protein VGH15_05905 [Caulobacteraceae bacterium]|jgi:hypothetical protein
MTTVLDGKPTFGAGRVFATANVSNPTPARALVPQGQSVDFKRKVESLFGEGQLPVEVGAGEMEVTGKVEYAKTQARFMTDIVFGDAGTVGQYLEADGEAGVVPTASTFTVTVANHGSIVSDLGVVNADTGAIYSRAVSPAAGVSYSGPTAGVYTFHSSDAGANVKLSYLYSNSTAGESMAMKNQLQGATGAFTAVHVLPWGAEQDIFVFNKCISQGAALAVKKSGFGTYTLEYMAATDGTDSLGTATFAEAA